MKKALSLALALALCLSLTIPALAASQAGDTTITDANGTYTLSNPILYTFTQSDMAEIDMDSMAMYVEGMEYDGTPSAYLDEFYWPRVETVYAVPEGTVVTLPSNLVTWSVFDLDVTWENGNCHATEFSTINYPGFTSIPLNGAGYVLTVELRNIDTGNSSASAGEGSGASGSAIGDGLAGAISFYVPKDGATVNPFTSSASTAPSTSGGSTFTDVAANAYYTDAIAWAVENGITNGTSATTFSPNQTCSRAQIITFLWRAAGSPEPKNISAFSDVKTDAYYAKAAAWAAENGMASGSTFFPDSPCTREMAMEFMWKHAGSPSAPQASFTDVSSKAVDWAVAHNVTNGTSATTFSPETVCTRAQIMTFLYRAFA